MFLARLAGSVAARCGAAATASPLPALLGAAAPRALVAAPALTMLQQVRWRKRPAWDHSKKAGRPYAGKGLAVWWQPLLPALAAERCKSVGGQGTNDAKRNQIRRQQSLWDVAKRKESMRRRRIFNTLQHDRMTERVRGVYASYAEMLREHPNGFNPSPSRSEQKRLWVEQRRAAAAPGVEAVPPPPG